jgi:hypothetical protein
VLKGSLPLGVVLNADMDKSINGCVAKNICSKKAIARDGRIQVKSHNQGKFKINFIFANLAR